MKKSLLLLMLYAISIEFTRAQCVYTCSNYAVSAITYTTFPSGSTNLTPTFTNTFNGPFADDGSIGPIPIGFNFGYYCSTYTAVHICSNGFIMLDFAPFPWPTQFVHATQNLPDPTLPNGMIAFNMTDLDPGQGGSVTYTTVGVAPNRMFIVTYSNVPCFTTPTNLNTGQIVLFETTNMIEIHTTTARPDINQSTLGGTQGIENTTGSAGITPPGRNANNTWGINSDNTAYKFAPYQPAPPIPVSGSTLLCQGTQNTYSIVAPTGASGYNWTFPAGWNGSGTTTAVTGTAGVSGNLSVTATYSCGTSVPATLSVTVLPAPVVTVLSINPPNSVCSGSNFTITPAGGVSYTLNPGSLVSNTNFIMNAVSVNSFTITGADANCPALNPAIAVIQINTSPTITVNSGTICEGQQFTISPIGVGADSYNVTGGFLIVTPTVGIHAYTVIGNNSTNGCNSVPVVSNLTVNVIPSVTVTSLRATICKGESEKLTASGAASYSWNTGATTSQLIVTPTITSQFTVTGKTAEGCSRGKTINILVIPCTAIEAFNAGELGVSVFPNPSNGTFHVELANANTNTTAEIYDPLGRLVLNRKTEQRIIILNLTDQPDGLYYLKIKNPEFQKTIKIIKE